jgi:hypothetical protein
MDKVSRVGYARNPFAYEKMFLSGIILAHKNRTSKSHIKVAHKSVGLAVKFGLILDSVSQKIPKSILSTPV